MKKNVLFGQVLRAGALLLVAACLSAPADAQNRVMAPVKTVKAGKFIPKVEPNTPVATNQTQKAPVRKGSSNTNTIAVATKTDIATSSNIYGSLVSEGTLAAYNSAVDVLSYTNRKSFAITPPVSNSGIVQTHVSYDKGQTWDTTLVLTANAGPVNRYPNGVVANPPGNTTANQAYAAVAAPLLDGSLWDGGTFASLRLDNQNGSVLNLPNASATTSIQFMPRLGMCTGTNGNVYVLGSNYDYNATAPYFDGAVVNRGVWNATNNNFDWDQSLIYHAFSHDPADGSQNFSSLGNIAFSQDGVTGYLVMIGRDSINDHLSPMPIIYRTTDAGATWSQYYTGDFSPLFQGFFPPSSAANPAVDRPFWYLNNSMDVQVDGNGKIHILCEVANSYSNDADSLGFLNSFGTIFDVYEDNTGNWNALWVGTIYTDPDPLDAATSVNTLGWAVTFDGRVQMCRSNDGTKMAYMWIDTDTSIAATNLYPNIIGVAADFTTSLFTNPINFTANGSYDSNNYWLCVAGDGWDASGNFVVPAVTSRCLVDGGLDTNPWMHEFVGGLEFGSADYVNPFVTSVNELPNSLSTISLYPNPTSALSNLVLDLKKGSNIAVNVVNNLGQTVLSNNYGFRAAGSNNLQLDLSEVATGLYVVQIILDGEMTSKTLNIQK